MKQFLQTRTGKLVLSAASVALIAVVIVAAVVIALPSDEAYRSISVVELEGFATVVRDDGKEIAAYEGMALFSGDIVSVGAESALAIELDGDKYMLAEAETVFMLEAEGKAGSDKTVIRLAQGHTLTRLENKLGEDQSFVMETPNATIAVRGTTWSLAALPVYDGYSNSFDGPRSTEDFLELFYNLRTETLHQVFSGRTEVTLQKRESAEEDATQMVDAGYAVGVTREKDQNRFAVSPSGERLREIRYKGLFERWIERLYRWAQDDEPFVEIREDHSYRMTPEDFEELLRELWPDTFGDTNTAPETDPPTDPETDPPTDPETDPPTAPETDPPTDPETDPPTDPETDPPTDPETDPPTDPETDPPTEPETDPPTDPETDPPTDPETTSPTDPETDPPHEHAWGDWAASDSDGEAHERGCTCGETETEAHKWDEGETVKSPTHLKTGELRYTCTVCGHTRTEELPKRPDHIFDRWLPSETDATQHVKVCVCGQQADMPRPHGWDAGTVTLPATHTAEGEMTYACAACGAARTEAIPKTPDHTWDAGVIQLEPTHLAEGKMLYTCAPCGETKTEIIDKRPEHDYSEWHPMENGTRHTRACECGDEQFFDHVWSAWTAAEDGTGHTRTCADCGATETQDHTWNSGVETVAATHLAEGKMRHTCTRCAATKTEPIAKLPEHSYGAWTATADGAEHSRACACGDVQTEDHRFAAWDDGQNGETHTHACMACGADETRAHRFEMTKEETDKNNDILRTYTCADCGYAKQETVHLFSEWIISEGSAETETGADPAPEVDPDRHARYCYNCDVVEEETHQFDENQLNSVYSYELDEEILLSYCAVCGYEKAAPEADHTHVKADTRTYDDTYHWYACTYESCTVQIDRTAHSLQQAADAESDRPAYSDESGLRTLVCMSNDSMECSYTPDPTPRPYEFESYALDFSNTGKPEFAMYERGIDDRTANVLAMGETFDPTQLRVIGLYADSVFDEGQGAYNHCRILEPTEYTVKYYYCVDAYTAVEIDSLTLCRPGQYLVRVFPNELIPDPYLDNVPYYEIAVYQSLPEDSP